MPPSGSRDAAMAATAAAPDRKVTYPVAAAASTRARAMGPYASKPCDHHRRRLLTRRLRIVVGLSLRRASAAALRRRVWARAPALAPAAWCHGRAREYTLLASLASTVQMRLLGFRGLGNGGILGWVRLDALVFTPEMPING
jgi:hypothetical protein